jgi:hypothetical protein
MRRKKAKLPRHSATKEVNFVSICTNDSFPDTLGIDRTYETVAGLSCMPCRRRLPRARRAAYEPSTESVRAARHDGWRATIYDAPVESGHERIGRVFAPISRHFAAEDRDPARKASSLGCEARSSHDGSNRSETNSRLPCARSFPSDAPGSGAFQRRFPPPRSQRRRPRLLPHAERPVREQYRSFTCSPPRVSIASREIVTNNKTTRGSPLRTSLISAGRRPLTVGEGQGSASRDRFTLSSFARPPIECDPARRLRLEAGFTPAVYDTSYKGPPPIRQTR